MIASRVKSEKEVFDILNGRGYSATEEITGTGTFWRHGDTGKHIQVPFSVDGFYPNWLLSDLEEIIGKLQMF